MSGVDLGLSEGSVYGFCAQFAWKAEGTIASLVQEQDSTLYAHWTYLEVSEGTNRSGGSSTPYRYYVTIPDNLIGGTVEASSVRAKFGASVVLTVQAHENYALDVLTVRGLRNREITLKNQGNGKDL